MLTLRPLTRPVAFLTICYSLTAATPPGFDADIKPIFQAKCVMCHGTAPQGKLDLRSQQSILDGGVSGPVVVPGAADKSLLLDQSSHAPNAAGQRQADRRGNRPDPRVDRQGPCGGRAGHGFGARGARHLSGPLRALSRLRRSQGRARPAHRGQPSERRQERSWPGARQAGREPDLPAHRQRPDAAGQTRERPGGGTAHRERDRKDSRVDRRRRTRSRGRRLCRRTPW